MTHRGLMVENREEDLSPYAAKSGSSRGRLKFEEPCLVRTAFQRDRDRIIYCKAFRRLKHKTQVFIAPLGDHYVTRLTHTLEVSQVARTIARALKLNEDLAEAISLGHDLGHTPFGHIGEEVLNELCRTGFRHNEQSLRIVDVLENKGWGLNLTWEVRDGILNHSKTERDILGQKQGGAFTLEGQVCKLADVVAYINHDIDDAIRADIITEDDLPPSAVKVLGPSHSRRINTMVCDIISSSWPVSGSGVAGKSVIDMSPGVLKATNGLRDFLFARVCRASFSLREANKVKEVIQLLYQYFTEHEDKLPVEYRHYSDNGEQNVVDYIAGMTDQYAVRLTEELSLSETSTG